MLLGTILFAMNVGSMARAEVEWRQRRLLLEPAAGAREAVGFFEFVNRGRAPVRVSDVQSGCGCTVAALDQEIVQPGETGRVRATFHVGDRQGRQSVAVHVTLQEPDARTYDLTLEVAIKDFVTVTPRLLYWRVGEDVSSKVFQLSLADGFRFVTAESTTPDFAAEIIEGPKDSLQLKVTPRDLWAKRSGAIVIKVAQPDQPAVEISAMVRVL